jgi:glycerol kinase
VQGALAAASVEAKQIAAIGITNQRETTALWQKTSGQPVHRAIVWQDRRTADTCAELKRRGLESLFREKTGLLLDPYFSGTKLAWLLSHVKDGRRKAQDGKLLFGTIDTYLAWRLTAGKAHVSDVSNASRTLLMDLRSSTWSPDLLEILEIPTAVLPVIKSNDEVFGHTEGLDFLPDGIPLAALIGDQQAALFGQCCFEKGNAKCTYGTGAFLLIHTGEDVIYSRRGLLSTTAWRIGGKTSYALEGSCFVAGAIVQWLRDNLDLFEKSADVEQLARTVEDSDGVVFVPALTGLGAPHWDPLARGLVCGITRGTTKGHLARAALEGIAFQVHDVLRAMQQDLGVSLRELKVDGGAASNQLLMQFQADVLGADVVRPQITATTALGAALQAGLTVKLFPSLTSIRKVWKEEARFKPKMKRRQAREALRLWDNAVRRART